MSDNILKPIGVLGGSFDPIHHGHLRLALEAYYRLKLDHIRLIPLKIPVHRSSPFADGKHRSIMIQKAIDGLEQIILDDRELQREDDSYTIDTLISLREQFPDHPICLLMGRDSFSTLDRWKDWQELLNYAHIIVASRHQIDKQPFNIAINLLLNSHQTYSMDDLHSNTHGKILRMQIPLLDISSTELRSAMQSRSEIRYLVPDSVIEYIHEEALYDTQ